MPMRQRSRPVNSRRTPARPLIQAVIKTAAPGTISSWAALPGITLRSAISSAVIKDTLSPTASRQNARTGRRMAKPRTAPGGRLIAGETGVVDMTDSMLA
jgi:hypothetical protein